MKDALRTESAHDKNNHKSTQGTRANHGIYLDKESEDLLQEHKNHRIRKTSTYGPEGIWQDGL